MKATVHSNGRRKPTAIDLFSGCGGLTRGLKDAGFKVVAAVEIDAKAKDTYRLNHPSVRLYASDIRELNPKIILKNAGIRRGDLDLVAGCPPCQGFSRLRTRNRKISVKDDRNNLIDDFSRFVEAMLPKSIMLENVPSLQKDQRFKKLTRRLRELGYQVKNEVLNAANYGVPQRRYRLILLASRVHSPELGAGAASKISVREALKGLAPPSRSKDSLHVLPERRSEAIKELIANIPKNGGSRADLDAKYQLPCHKRNDGFYDVYGRMAWDDVAPTITSGCHNPSKGRFLHPSYNRNITLREAAILQGFPREYKFDISHGKEAIALMIGNALPPPFICAHASSLKAGIKGAERMRRPSRKVS